MYTWPFLAELEVDVFDGAQAAWDRLRWPTQKRSSECGIPSTCQSLGRDQILGQGHGGSVAISICNADFDGKGGCGARVDPDVAQFEDDEGGIGLGRRGQCLPLGSS